jgi:hypothetical protein
LLVGNEPVMTDNHRMTLTNAEKQARYRERHLENGAKTRGHFFLEVITKAKLLRRITGIAACLR